MMDGAEIPPHDIGPPGEPAPALLAHEPLLEAWRRDGGTADAAAAWTRHQVRALHGLVRHDPGWEQLVDMFQRGRAIDPWLAADWPHGFDELLLCAPLCQLVRFDCARCRVGARQKDFSCAHPGTLFGSVGTLLEHGDREGLLQHLGWIEEMLRPGSRTVWDPETGRPVRS